MWTCSCYACQPSDTFPDLAFLFEPTTIPTVDGQVTPLSFAGFVDFPDSAALPRAAKDSDAGFSQEGFDLFCDYLNEGQEAVPTAPEEGLLADQLPVLTFEEVQSQEREDTTDYPTDMPESQEVYVVVNLKDRKVQKDSYSTAAAIEPAVKGTRSFRADGPIVLKPGSSLLKKNLKKNFPALLGRSGKEADAIATGRKRKIQAGFEQFIWKMRNSGELVSSVQDSIDTNNISNGFFCNIPVAKNKKRGAESRDDYHNPSIALSPASWAKYHRKTLNILGHGKTGCP